MTTKNETFNFTENPLSTNWDVAQAGGLKGTATGANAVNSSGFAVSSWKESNYNFDDDQSSQITVASLTAYDMPGVAIRFASTGGGVGYVGYYDNGDSRFYIKRYSAGAVAATLRQTNSFTMANGDTLKLSIVGTTLQAFKNGVQIGADLVVTGADIVTGGQPGIMYRFANSNVTLITAWEGVDAAAAGPAITGGTANPIHLSTGNTITGTGFGAAQGAGTLVIGGQAQTVTAWADTSITYTANRGVNLNDVAVNAVVTDNGGTPSANYALTGFDPPAGYYFVTLTSVNATAANRITAIADLAIGNQLEWDNADVTINNDATWDAADTVTSFNVRVGVTTDGWGSLALQTVNAASPGGANSATGGRLIRPFNKRVGLGF